MTKLTTPQPSLADIDKALLMDRNHNANDSLPRLSKLNRFRQYQPSNQLVKLLLLWWLVVAFISALSLSHGFGNEALSTISSAAKEWIGFIAGLSLLIIMGVVLIDLCCLISLSQPARFKLNRQHPSNVPVLHQLDVNAYLGFDIHAGNSLFDRMVQPLSTVGLIKTITIDFYDDFPNHLALVEPNTSVVEIDSTYDDYKNNKAMPIQIVMDTNNRLTDNSSKLVDRTQTHPSGAHFNTFKITYPVIALQRGTGYFGTASIRVWSPLKLCKRQFRLASKQINQPYIRVLADFSGLLNNQLSAVFEHSLEVGLQTLLKQGHGSDFLKLREYTPGDAIRQIDWKASSRQRRLMSKSYEDDNNQDVMFLLDCGEQMRHHDTNPKKQMADSVDENKTENTVHGDIEGLLSSKITQQLNLQTSYFDKVLNAVLLLSYVANKQGDRVGLMTFAGEDLYLPPKKGAPLIRNLLNATADLKPSMQTCDYLTAAQSLIKRLNKCSLIVVITNTRAEANEELMQALKLLSRRHQVVFANLTEQIVHNHMHGNVPPEDFDEALLYHALNNYQQGRNRLHKNLIQQTGAVCLQTTANKLPMRLTQAYLSLKRK